MNIQDGIGGLTDEQYVTEHCAETYEHCKDGGLVPGDSRHEWQIWLY